MCSESIRPLDWWQVHLSDKELSLGVLLSDMAAHNVHWDYPNHIIYETKVAASVERILHLMNDWQVN